MMKILVLEDETRLRKLYRRDLAQDGYEVLTAGSSETFLEDVDSASPDLVVFDLEHTRIGGVDAMRSLMRRCPRVPVLVVGRDPRGPASNLDARADAHVVHAEDTVRMREKIRQLFWPEAI